jgi:hypothetical protein
MEKKKFLFFKVLKDNSSKKNYDNNDEILHEWNIFYHSKNMCGHRNFNEDSDNCEEEELDGYDCVNCICGEKCIYNIFHVKNKINDIELVVGSKCVKNFMKDNYEKYKVKKKILKKESTAMKKDEEKKKKEEEKNKKLEQMQEEFKIKIAKEKLDKDRCDNCSSVLIKSNCFTCKFIKPEHILKLKNKHFIEWVENKASKEELKGYLKLLYNFIIKKRENEIEIDKLEMIADYKKWLKKSIKELILMNPKMLDDDGEE